MAFVRFNHIRVSGIKTVVPEHGVSVDDELQYEVMGV